MAKLKNPEINNRIKQIRLACDLSMEAYGELVGISKQSVYKIETLENNPSEQTLELTCIKLRIDPFWLETGVGDMFTAIPETIIDSLVDEFDLDNKDRYIIETYLQAPESQRNAIKDFLLTLAEKAHKKNEE